MRIAFIHNTFPAGGAERITIDIARYLKSQGGYDVFVYATHRSEALWNDELDSILTFRSIPSQAIQRRRSKVVESLVVSDRIDVLVQVTKALPGIDGIRRRTGVKSVIACHGEPFWQRYAITYRRQKGALRRLLWRLYNKRRFADGTLAMEMAIKRTMSDYLSSDAYTVLCEPYKKEVERVLGVEPEMSRIHAIENPESPVDDVCWEKDNVILFCGRFENWSKRIDRLLRIWAGIQDRLPDWKLQLVGSGPAEGMLRRMAEELKLERVSFEGRQADVSGYYRKASVVVLTSETEGWPLALSEGQAHGCVGVAFGATAGITEILSPDGECGFIVPPFDEDAFADTLLKIALMSDDEKMKVRRNSVAKRKKYHPESIAAKWKVMFDSLDG